MNGFWKLFPVVRSLETRLDIEYNRRIEAERRETMAQAAGLRVENELQEWKKRCDDKDKRIAELTGELTEKMGNAGDAVALRLMGKRLFGKAPVDQTPQPPKAPVNISPGSQKMFGRDAVRQRTGEFFKKLAKESGVDAPPPAN